MAIRNGNSENNNLIGTPSNDVLNGYGGNDTLNGGAGIDTLVGGADNDTYIVDSTSDIIREDEGGGAGDTVRSSVSYTLGEWLNNLTLTGTMALNGTGNSLDNIIRGNDANNILDGRGGIDTLIGGKGNDTYIVDTTTDTIIENEGGGSGDTVQSSVSYTLGEWLNNLTLTGTSAINGTGNSLDNTITGNNADNILLGEGGNDTINGIGSNADKIYGGAGDDSLSGGGDLFGSGGYTYMYGGDGNDFLNGSVAEIHGGDGNDTMIGTFATVYGDDGNDRLDGGDSGVYGGDGNDTLTGGESGLYGGNGDDVLTATYSHTTMTGGNGNDTLTSDGGTSSFIFNAPTEGIDTIVGFVGSLINTEFGDQIVVSASGFRGGLTAGAAITPEQFRIGTAAADASDRFIYNNTTGALFFDPTGSNNGATDRVRLATLVGAPDIINNDIFVTT